MNTAARLAALALLVSASVASAQGDSPVLDLEGAKSIIAGAAAEARRVSAPGGAIAVVDEGGHLLALERWPGTFPAAAQISTGKARTAALFRKPTKAFEEAINKGRIAMTTLPDSLLTPLQGGVPIVVEGKVIGAVGMSGAASAQQDEELALAGVKAYLDGGAR